jgi:hypothetical protein
VGTYRRRFCQEIEIRVQETAGAWIARAYRTESGESILLHGAPLEVAAADEHAALNRAIEALQRHYGTMET